MHRRAELPSPISLRSTSWADAFLHGVRAARLSICRRERESEDASLGFKDLSHEKQNACIRSWGDEIDGLRRRRGDAYRAGRRGAVGGDAGGNGLGDGCGIGSRVSGDRAVTPVENASPRICNPLINIQHAPIMSCQSIGRRHRRGPGRCSRAHSGESQCWPCRSGLPGVSTGRL